MTNPSRRSALKAVVGTAVAAPVMFIAKDALAAKNDALRTALQYQDTPKDGNKCVDCLHFQPGADAAAKGGCAILPGDTEIAPEGWCSAYVKKPS
ncbi:MAG: high-potential iron-sulfur protein [Burkholderiaceae bacterium]